MKKYIIKANKHFSKLFGFLPHFGFTFYNTISREGKFDQNCLYDISTDDKWDINKLFGFSTSYSHMTQSARVGWRCTDNENIELVTYCHDQKIRLP